jgi:hypothetical protein
MAVSKKNHFPVQEERETPVEWAAFILSVFCAMARSLNMGYMGYTYGLSIACYAVFAAHSRKRSQIMLNVFYAITALVGIWRWGLA